MAVCLSVPRTSESRQASCEEAASWCAPRGPPGADVGAPMRAPPQGPRRSARGAGAA